MTYGLYIYHWPIRLWLGPHLGDLPTSVSVAIQFAVTVVVSLLSFRYLELPVVTRGLRGLLPRLRRREELPTAIAAVGVIALAAAVVFVANPGGTGPLGDTGDGDTAGVDRDAPAVLADGQPQHVAGDPGTVGVFGDSVGHYLAERFPQDTFPGAEVVNVSVEGCDLLDAPITIVDGVNGQNREQCRAVKQTWDETLVDEDADALMVVLSPLLAMPHEVDGEQLDLEDSAYRTLITDRLDEMIDQADAAGIEQVAVVNVPCRDIDEDEVPAVVRLFGQSHPKVVAEYRDPTTLNALVEDWAGERPEVDLVDMYDTLCGTDPVTTIDGAPLFNDFLHFSPEASPAVWSWLLGQLSEARGA